MRTNSLYLLPVLAGPFLFTACVPVHQLQSAAAAGGALANSMAGSIVGQGEPIALGAVELRQLQARDFATSKSAAFASAMTVLLDTGYRVQSADLESGLITATASSTARLRLDTTGLSRASQTPVASVYVEDRGESGARVRIVFSLGSSATGPLAVGGERAVLDRTVYESFFSRLGEEIEQRPVVRQAPVEHPAVAAPEPGARPSPSQSEPFEGADATETQAPEPESEPEPKPKPEPEPEPEMNMESEPLLEAAKTNETEL